jgi:uncharacterized membrane protein
MPKISTNIEVDAQDTGEILEILDNLARDLGNVQDRADRLAEHGVDLTVSQKDGQIKVTLSEATTS